MGALTDYFRAVGATSVVEVLERTDGGSPLGAEPPAFDGVEAKHVDPTIVLAMLIAAIRQVEWRVELVGETTVWPASPAPGPDGSQDEDDPWMTGPWVSNSIPWYGTPWRQCATTSYRPSSPGGCKRRSCIERTPTTCSQ